MKIIKSQAYMIDDTIQLKRGKDYQDSDLVADVPSNRNRKHIKTDVIGKLVKENGYCRCVFAGSEERKTVKVKFRRRG